MKTATITIRAFQQADWPLVQTIYQQGIDTKDATFQKKAKSWDQWHRSTLPVCRLVAVAGDNETVVGWAALSSVSRRQVYTGVAEVSIYVSLTQQGQGIGQKLLQTLIAESEKNEIWMLQAGIFPENGGSITLHKKCGFREVGLREKVGKMDDVWRDVILLERRSRVVGVQENRK